MDLKDKVKNVFNILMCITGLLLTFYSIVNLTYFLSVPDKTIKISAKSEPWSVTSWALLTDSFLLSLFIAQHSFMASDMVKNAFDSPGLKVAYRSFYVISTATVLKLLMQYWKSAPAITFWHLNLEYKPVLWWYAGVHVSVWLIIYIANICMDVTELLGIKQVYYNLFNVADPNIRKSHRLKRLNSHMRHPSFLAFVLIFWFYPTMTLDRFLLASILTLYMYLAWNTDAQDYHYHKSQYDRKYHELIHRN